MLCVTIGWLINTVYHKIQGGQEKLKRVRSLIHVTSLPEKEGFLYQRVGGLFKRGVNISVNSKTSNLPPGIPQVHVFDWSFALCSLWKQPFFLAPCRCMETFHGEELLRLSDKKIHNDDVKSVWNQVRSADWSMENLHCLSYCLWMTDKIQKATKNVNAMNINKTVNICGI